MVRRLILDLRVKRIDLRRHLGSLAFVLSVTAAAPALAATAGTEETNARATVAVQQVRLPVAGFRDAAAMVLVGTALIGLASAVRRSA